jgi:radical SAM superfamily enzyme YgiQ (UPF0313 family)
MYQTGRTPDYNPKEPMGLMYLAAELRRRGLRAEILDADLQALTIEETVGEIIARPAVVIGFSVLQRALPSLKVIIERLREHRLKSHICCGGVGATLSAIHLLDRLPDIDSVVLGDGELTLADLTEHIKYGYGWQQVPGLAYRGFGGINFNEQPIKPDLDELLPPVRDILPTCLGKTNYATIVGSRGCYGGCTFCSNSSFERHASGPKWRGRNPLSIVDEIELLHREYGVRAVKFNDPNLFGPGRRGQQHVETMCQELIRRGLNDRLSLMAFTRASDLTRANCRLLRQAGFERMLIGIETFVPRVLQLLHKGETAEQIRFGISCLQSAGISVVPGFIIFNPYTTFDSLEHDLGLLDHYRFAVLLSKSMRIFDGTALQRIMLEEGRLHRRDPFVGYHEYTVDRSVAAVYGCLKEVAVHWLRPLTQRYQDKFWEIKKGSTFVSRTGYYSIQHLIYSLESGLLRRLIAWVRSGQAEEASVTKALDQSRSLLRDLENFYVGTDDNVERLTDSFSTSCLVRSVREILREQPYESFPEKYRWAND